MQAICIVDYHAGNIFSVQNTLNALGAESYISSNPEEIKNASKILFPGVGSFGAAMKQLKELKLDKVLIEKANSDTPFLGICVGMQVLFEHGTENSNGNPIPGLGVFKGSIDKFSAKVSNANLKIPHMGWNQIHFDESYQNENPLFTGIKNDSDFYFVHSYRASYEAESIKANQEKFPDMQIIKSNYGEDFISSIWNGKKLFACQFHAEKSGKTGLKVIKNFIDLQQPSNQIEQTSHP